MFEAVQADLTLLLEKTRGGSEFTAEQEELFEQKRARLKALKKEKEELVAEVAAKSSQVDRKRQLEGV